MLKALTRLVIQEEDDTQLRGFKFTFICMVVFLALIGLLHFSVYVYFGTDPVIYVPPLCLWFFAIVVYISMLVHKNLSIASVLFISFCIAGPMYYQYSLGGFQPSAGMAFYSLLPLMGTLTCMSLRYARYYLWFFLFCSICLVAAEYAIPKPDRFVVPQAYIEAAYTFNLFFPITTLFLISYYFVDWELQTKTLYRNQLSAINNTLSMVELDQKGKILKANNIFASLINRQKESLRHAFLEEFIDYSINSFDDLDLELADIIRRQDRSMRIALKNESGKILHFVATFTVVFDNEGKFKSILMLASDVTADRLKVQNLSALYDTIDKYHSILDLNLSGHIIGSNMTFVNTFEINVTTMMTEGFSAILDQDMHQSFEFELLIKKVIEEGFDLQMIYLRTRSGETKTFESRFYLVHDQTGKPQKIVVIMDIVHPDQELIG